MRAALKVETIREDLGKVGPIIAQQVEEAMLGKRCALDTTQAEKDAEPVRRMLSFERKLKEQLEKLVSQLQETKRTLRLSPENILNVVETGLSLAGQPPLKQVAIPGILPDKSGRDKTSPAYNVSGLSGSWSRCIDGLAHPHTHIQRPIVFDNA